MKYELSMFLSPKMTDEEAEKRVKELDKILEKFEAKILESNFLGKKDLAYSINHFNQGYYFIAKIEAEPDQIKRIKNKVNDDLEVIRLLVTKQKKDVKLELADGEKNEEIVKETKVEEKPLEEKKAEPKEIKESKLDKELDKILEGEIVD